MNSVLSKFDMTGKTALVTGAGSGIGLAYAEALAECGAKVSLTDRSGRAKEEAERLREEGYDVRADIIDVSDEDQVSKGFDAHKEAFGPLHAAFANAGIDAGKGYWNPAGHRNEEGQIDVFNSDDWHRSMATNLNGIYYTIKHAARLMKADNIKGSIVATSSNASHITVPIVGMPYMAAKAGVSHLVRQIARELAEYNIRVNTIAPGSFVTNIANGALKNPEVRAAWAKTVPMGDMADCHQIKPLAVYLASDASDFVTGSEMLIDGGVSLQGIG